MNLKTLGLGIAAILMASAALAQTPPAPPAGARPDLAGTEEERNQRRMLFESWAKAIPAATGPLKVVREEPASLPEHTVFRPATFPAGAVPVIAFGNGGCRNTPIEFTAFLTEVASHGYMIIAAGTNDVEFATADFRKVMPNGKPLQRTEPSELTAAVDWAQQVNARADSPYYQKLDVKKIAYVGQSCGGMQALGASLDPRTTTTVVLNSGLFQMNGAAGPGGMQMPAGVDLAKLHAPVVYFAGGPTDIAYKTAEADFQVIQQPLFLANLPVGHTGAYPKPDLRWSRAVVGWLDWQLKGDAKAADQFVGAKCGLCVDKEWTVKSKNLAAKK